LPRFSTKCLSFPLAVIQHAVCLYGRFTLSLSDFEEKSVRRIF